MVFVLVAVMSIPTFITGGGAEHYLEEVDPGVSHELIHEHEDAASTASIAMYILGAFALFSLYTRRSTRAINGALLIGSVIVFGLMVWVGNEGGMIEHRELQQAETATTK